MKSSITVIIRRVLAFTTLSLVLWNFWLGYHRLSFDQQWKVDFSTSLTNRFSSIRCKELKLSGKECIPCSKRNGCWRSPHAHWVDVVDAISYEMVAYAEELIKSINGNTFEMKENGLIAQSSHWQEEEPVVPDVAVHYPCVEDCPGNAVSLASFRAIKAAVPSHANTIYILTSESMNTSKVCERVVKHLLAYLSNTFPCKVVKVFQDLKEQQSGRRPAIINLNMARLVKADVTVCSGSDYCLWPALARTHKTTYFPSLPSLLKLSSSSSSSSSSLSSNRKLSAKSLQSLLNIPSVSINKKSDAAATVTRLKRLDLAGREPAYLGNDETTVVSAFYMVSSKHTSERYLTWTENFMKMNFKCVIYVNDKALDKLSSRWPPNDRRMYVLKPFQNFTTSAWSWKEDERLDLELLKGHNAQLYQIWNEKIFFVSEVAQKNPFNTQIFAWVDIGCFRDADSLPRFSGFPDPAALDPNKITFLQVYPFLEEEKALASVLDSRFQRVDRIGGGHFAGTREAILKYKEVFADLISEAKENGVFAGKDQSLYAFSVLRHPYLVTSVDPVQDEYDRWMILHVMWSSSAMAAPASCGAESNKVFAVGRGGDDLIVGSSSSLSVGRSSSSSSSSSGGGGGGARSLAKSSIPQQQYQDKEWGDRCRGLILIPSTLSDVARRQSIREGWLTDMHYLQSPVSFKHRFVVGRDSLVERGINGTKKSTEEALRIEMQLFDDVMFIPFEDGRGGEQGGGGGVGGGVSGGGGGGEQRGEQGGGGYSSSTPKVAVAIKCAEAHALACDTIVHVSSTASISAIRLSALIRGIPFDDGRTYFGGFDVMPTTDKRSMIHQEEEKGNGTQSVGSGGHGLSVSSRRGLQSVYFMSSKLAMALPYSVDCAATVGGDNAGEIQDIMVKWPSHLKFGGGGAYSLDESVFRRLIAETNTSVAPTYWPIDP